MITVRSANDADFASMWPIIRAVVEPGDTYALPRDFTRDAARAMWFPRDNPRQETFVAVDESSGQPDRVVGLCFIRPNQPGPGSHVANAAYMVDPAARGRGVGRAMGEHSIVTARARGYRAMQFNFVVSTNIGAVELWKSLGFAIVGTIPLAFAHATRGFVDVLVMHREL